MVTEIEKKDIKLVNGLNGFEDIKNLVEKHEELDSWFRHLESKMESHLRFEFQIKRDIYQPDDNSNHLCVEKTLLELADRPGIKRIDSLSPSIKEFVKGAKTLEFWNREDKHVLLDSMKDILEAYQDMKKQMLDALMEKNQMEDDIRRKVKEIMKEGTKKEQSDSFNIIYQNTVSRVEQSMMLRIAKEEGLYNI